MTTKELFENLLAGKKMRDTSFLNGNYIHFNSKGELVEYYSNFNKEYRIDTLMLYHYLYSPLSVDVKCSEWVEYIPLTQEEKEYLDNVIRPHRENVDYIIKRECLSNAWIHVSLSKGDDCISFPVIKPNLVYKDMEVDKHYTLEELGI